MGNIRHPRRGSMQFWPRKRAKVSLARVRSWNGESKVKPLAFIGYKAGMTHIQVINNRAKSLTKGEEIIYPVTMIDCPPLNVAGAVFYKQSISGSKKITSFLTKNLDKNLAKKISLPKKEGKQFPGLDQFTDLRILVYSNPVKTSTGVKKPKMMEVALGGSKEEKLAYAREMVGKQIKVSDVFGLGNLVDVHGITKGKGFQGTVKRYGVPIRQHKAEKTKRGIATLGSWTPKRVEYTVAQSGKMGYHLRTEYNKQILKIGENGKEELNFPGGITGYGIIKGNYVLLKGSVVGPKKRAVLLVKPVRANSKVTKDAPEIKQIVIQK